MPLIKILLFMALSCKKAPGKGPDTKFGRFFEKSKKERVEWKRRSVKGLHKVFWV
jgi:hypothetical protein